MASTSFDSIWTLRALGLLRIAAAYMFLLHGTAKVFAVPHVPMFDGLPLLSFYGAVGVFEVAFGLLLLVGLLSRLSAFLLSGQMAVAYFIGHAVQGNALVPMLNGGEPAALFSFIFLLIAAAGPGAWALDRIRWPAGGVKLQTQ